MIVKFLSRTSVKWTLTILGVLLFVYVILGVFWVPSYITGKMSPLAKPYGLATKTATSSFNPFTFRYTLGKTRVTRGDSTVLSLDQLSVNFDPLPSLYHGNLNFSSIEVDSPDLYVRRNASGTVNLMEILASVPVDPETVPKTVQKSVKESWELVLDRVHVTGGGITWKDHLRKTTRTTTVRDLEFTARLLQYPLDREAPFSLRLDLGDGQLQTEGSLHDDRTFSTDFSLEEIPLTPLNDFLPRTLPGRLTGGQMFGQGKIEGRFDGTDITLESSTEVQSLELTEDPDRTLASVSSVSVDTIALSRTDRSLALREITVDSPLVNLVREPGGSLNIRPSSPSRGDTTQPKKTSAPAEPWSLEIGPTNILSGKVTFADRSLDKPLRIRIEPFTGTAGVITRDPADTVSVELQARIAGEAPLDAQATMSPGELEKTMDLKTQLRELSLPPFSSYTTRFVGHRIDGGKLHLTLDYKLRDARLTGSNKLTLNRFNLGEKVNENPVIDVPIKMAVALLKNRNGSMKLSIPVEGNLRKPDFQLQGTINEAIGNAIQGIVTSPYDFLAGIVGTEAANLRSIDFPPGSHELTQGSSTSLEKLAEALRLRPLLQLEIRPAWSEADRQFLAQQQLNPELQKLGGNAQNLVQSRNALEKLFDREFSPSRRRELLERHTTRPEDSLTDQVDREAYADELYDQLLEANEPNEEKLNELATKRAHTILTNLQEREISDERLYVLDRLQLDDPNAPTSLPLELSPK